MRIVSYNILDGATRRENAVGGVILGRQPDVVGLVEADNQSVVRALAARCEMDFIWAPAPHGAAALLSRYALRQTINHAALHTTSLKALLGVQLLDADGAEWTFGVVHLSARATEADEVKRESELNYVLSCFEPHRTAGRRHLLLGDFNSNAPAQQIDPARCKSATRQAWDANGGGVPRRVVQRLLDSGYVDTFAAAEPEQSIQRGSFTTDAPGQRVDYIFSFGFDRAKIERAWIDQSGPAVSASDHFPIGAELSA